MLSFKNELTSKVKDHAHFSARSAVNTLTHLHFLVLFFSLACSSLCLMLCKTIWGFCGVHIRHRRHSKPCSGVSQFQVKTDEEKMKAPASSSSTCFSAFSAAVCCRSSCAFVQNDIQHLLRMLVLHLRTINLLKVFSSSCENQNVSKCQA